MADEIDLPPGIPRSAAGSGGASTVGAFKASGQPDVNRFLTPTPTPTPSPSAIASPAPTQVDSWLARARDGLMNFIGLGSTASLTPSVQPIVAPNRSAALESDLNDLERRSTTPANNFYQTRVPAYAAAQPTR